MNTRALALAAPGCQPGQAVEDVLARLDALGCRPRRRPNGHHAAQCPAHDGSRPSLDVVTGRDGRTLVHCFAGCAPEEVCGALGIELRALAPFSVERLRTSDVLVAQTPSVHSLSVVSLLAAHAAGALYPVPIGLAKPCRAGRVKRAVAADLELLFGLRLAVGDKRSLVYAVGWAAGRLGEDRGNVGRALRSLVKDRVIAPAGKLRPEDDRRRRRWPQKYRLPSELAGRVDVPSRASAVEAAARVAAVGRVEPVSELHRRDRVAVTELDRARVKVAERRLAALEGGAGRLVVVGSEGSAEGVEMVHGTDLRSLRGAA